MYRSLLALAATATLSLSMPLTVRDAPQDPSVGDNFPDPSLIKDGDTWYAFSTTGGLAKSQDFNSWSVVPNAKPLPASGKWAKPNSGIWAPDVIRLPNNGKFVMYYTSPSPNKPKGGKQNQDYQCIGTATSDSVEGPYQPQDDALACPLDQGGAIDVSGFVDKDGSVWAVYKIDGNSMGKPTPIMLQKMQSDGTTPDGNPTQILVNDKNDGPVTEAPSLVRADDTYFLFFSSNMYNTDKYDVSYAVSKNGITNGGKMYAKAHAPAAPLLKTDKRWYAPGGLDIDPDGQHVVFHADKDRKWDDHRPMWAGTVTLDSQAGTVKF